MTPGLGGIARDALRALLIVAVLAVLPACGASDWPAMAAPPGPTAAAPAAAAPTGLRIPALEVTSDLTRTGMLTDGSPEVPPVDDPGQASWATWSPEPGTVGPAVLYGHVNGTVNGVRGVPGVFARIDQMQPGQEILVAREDGTTAVFAVTRVKTWAKADFDRDGAARREVYGDTSGPELRLITCGGDFDPAAHSYLDQVVVFAQLAGDAR